RRRHTRLVSDWSSDVCSSDLEGAVAMQLDELLEDELEVVKRLRSLWVPRHLDRLPGRQVAVDLPLQVDQLAADSAHLLAAADLAASVRLQSRQDVFEFVDLSLEAHARLRPPCH